MLPGLSERCIEPETLDDLPPGDPRAIGSRRDLALINRLMFQAAIMSRLLRDNLPRPPRRLLEIGSGDGRFMLAVAAKLARRWPGVELTLLDRAAVESDKTRKRFEDLGWRVTTVTADVFDWLATSGARFDAVTANLFLHHFSGAQLSRLFSALGSVSPVVIATEPHRNLFALGTTRLLWAIGANAVTRHDAPASVAAGFRGRELSGLWPASSAATMHERRIGPFTHVFAAVAGPAGTRRDL